MKYDYRYLGLPTTPCRVQYEIYGYLAGMLHASGYYLIQQMTYLNVSDMLDKQETAVLFYAGEKERIT